MPLPDGTVGKLKELLDTIEELSDYETPEEKKSCTEAADQLMELASSLICTMDLVRDEWKKISEVCRTLEYTSDFAKVYLSLLRDVAEVFSRR